MALVLVSAAPAYAAGAGHAAVFTPADILGIGHLVGSVFGSIGHAVLGAFSWTFKLAENFLLTTIGAVVKLLIPRSWAREGVQIMRWIVQVPDYAGTITSPTGQQSYGFAGINALRDLFTWIGAALLPLTLVYATSRAAIGHGDPVAVPIIRVLALGAVLLSYPYWWSQAAAVINQMTYLVLSLDPVVSGLHKLMLYAVDGVALGGWQLIDLALMAAIAIQLLALIFLKVAIILLGALLYATGPVTIGLIPTDAGAAITRAWLSAVGALLLLPVAWAAVFAVGALLINDAGSAGPLIAGQSDIGSLPAGCCSRSLAWPACGCACAPPAKPAVFCACSSAGCSPSPTPVAAALRARPAPAPGCAPATPHSRSAAFNRASARRAARRSGRWPQAGQQARESRELVAWLLVWGAAERSAAPRSRRGAPAPPTERPRPPG